MNLSQERKGELIITAASFLFALFPLIVTGSRGEISIFLFLGLTYSISAIFFFIMHIRNISGFFQRISKAKKHIFLGFFYFIGIYVPAIFFLGQQIDTGNMAILFQTEILFAFVFFVLFLGHEKFVAHHTIGMILLFLGTLLVLWKKGSWGDSVLFEILFIGVMLLGPLAAYHEKESLKYILPLDYLLVQRILGAILFLPLGLFFSTETLPEVMHPTILFLIVLNGILSFGIAEWLWILSLKYIGASKATTISGSTPAITLIYLIIFWGELPTWQQVVGVMLTFVGIFLLFEKQKKP